MPRVVREYGEIRRQIGCCRRERQFAVVSLVSRWKGQDFQELKRPRSSDCERPHDELAAEPETLYFGTGLE